MKLALIAIAVCGCDRRTPIATCTDDLGGTYEVDPGSATVEHPERWNIIDHRRAPMARSQAPVARSQAIEVYPDFDDSRDAPAGIEMAPRAIDLRRVEGGLAGEVTRRYMKGARRCDAKASARITSCSGDTLEIVFADPPPPIAYDPCAWGQFPSSRRERWRRR